MSLDDLFLSKEHLKLKEKAKDFVTNRVKPLASYIEEKRIFPRELLKEMAELGFMGLMTPRKYGGSNLGITAACIVTEEVSKESPALSLSYGPCLFAQVPIKLFGGEEMKRKYLTKMASGEFIGAIAITEKEAGSDVASMTSRADKRGDYYVINGKKWFITNAGEADVYTFYAKTNPSKKHEGMSTFVIEVEKGGPGFKFKKNDTIGCRGISNGEIIFENYPVPKENLIGKEGKGFYYLMKMFSPERLILSAQSIGIMEKCLEESLDWVSTREQFGRKLMEYQHIQFNLADLDTMINIGKSFVYSVARLYDDGKDVDALSAMAKNFTSPAVFDGANTSLQMHGGRGYCRNLSSAGQRLFDAKLPSIGGGTTEIMKMIIWRKIKEELEKKQG